MTLVSHTGTYYFPPFCSQQLGAMSEPGGEPGGFMPSNHPLMERIQRALFNQLTKADERVTLELRERTAAAERVKAQREEKGVELYMSQQALAKLQMSLESKHEEFTSVVQEREATEMKVSETDKVSTQLAKEREAVSAKRDKAQKELDKVKLMLRQIEDHNASLASDIMVTRRAAYGTEESMQKLELDKARQDERIALLQTQVKTLQKQAAVHSAQADAQREEALQARKALHEAQAELELIEAEKREYMQKWRSSLAAMANRDAALQAARDTLHALQDRLRTLQITARGFRARTDEQRAENDKLQALVSRADAEGRFLDAQMQQLEATRRGLSERYAMLRAALADTDTKLRAAMTAQRELKADIDQLHAKYEKQVQAQQRLDDQIMDNIGKQTTIEKSAQNVFKATQKLKKEVHEKQNKIGEIQNEVARIKVDALNTEAHNQELSATLKAYDEELKNKDKLIEKYEAEIRQRHDKIDKKQVYIARLNKKLEKLSAGAEDEHTGPLEATIHSMSKEILTLEKDSAEKQKQWVKAQTELVSVVQETEEERSKLRELDARHTVLQQKRLRLRDGLETENEDIKDLQRRVRHLHTSMRKVNELINKYCQSEASLGNTIFCAEGEFTGRLRDLELESVGMEGTAARIRAEKDEVLNQIVEAEKEILLWEKKIQLAKETQEALNPEYGQPEIQGMKKEIHRMKLRLQQLQRQQEKMIQEMELAIAKRETIQLNSLHLITGKAKDPEKATQMGIRKAAAGLKQQLEGQLKESRQVEIEIAKQEEQSQILLDELHRQQDIYTKAEDARNTLRTALDDAFFVKQMNLENILVAQKKSKMFEDAAANKLRVNVDQDKLSAELAKQEGVATKVRTGLQRLMEDNPKYQHWFKRLLDMR